MQQADPRTQGTLADRGVGWQAAGFTLTGIACVVILQEFEGSSSWPYEWFEAASVRLYWAFLVPLAALFDGGRKLFEKGKAIREAKKAEIREKGRREGEERERQRIMKELEAHGIHLPPTVAEAVLGKRTEDDS
jgi:hypothetical protein